MPDAIAELLGRRGRRIARLDTLALILGDFETALWAARRRAGRGEEQALFASLVAEWELGGEEGACDRATRLMGSGRPGEIRAAFRFYHYIERPDAGAEALSRLGGERHDDLRLDLAAQWRRHGEPERCLELLEVDPHKRSLRVRWDSERIAARGEAEALAWRWPGRRSQENLSLVPGRILHMVSRSLPHHHAGSTYRTHSTVGAQRAAGLDAQVVTECGFPGGLTGPAGDHAEAHDGVPYHRLPSSGSDLGLDGGLHHHLERASELFSRLRPALLHPASDFRNAAVALELRERFELPVVYEVRGFIEEYLTRRPGSRILYAKYGSVRVLEAECWRRADHVVTLAEVMKRHIASKGVDPEQITVIPNAVDMERFRPVKRDAGLAAELGFVKGDVVLGYVTNLNDPHEGVRYLLEAVARLRARDRPVRALLVGDGAERRHLVELAARLGIADRVVFTGRLEQRVVPSYYGLIDIFVIPRASEPATRLVTPLKPFEAMAMEKPVVVSATEALREVVEDGRYGRMFEPEDVEDMAGTLEQLIEVPEERHELGQMSRQWVAETRTWGRNAERYREIYAELGGV